LRRGSHGDVLAGMACRVLLLAMLVVLCTPRRTTAQQPWEAMPIPRPVRLEGYWDRTRDDPQVIGDLVVAAKGAKRRFGVTAVQAYKPEEEGIQIFRFTSDHPATLLVRGDRDAVRRFFEAPRDRKLVAFGTYNPGSGTFALGSVDVGERRQDERR